MASSEPCSVQDERHTCIYRAHTCPPCFVLRPTNTGALVAFCCSTRCCSHLQCDPAPFWKPSIDHHGTLTESGVEYVDMQISDGDARSGRLISPFRHPSGMFSGQADAYKTLHTVQHFAHPSPLWCFDAKRENIYGYAGTTYTANRAGRRLPI